MKKKIIISILGIPILTALILVWNSGRRADIINASGITVMISARSAKN